MAQGYSPRQRTGSEFGGIAQSHGGIQPKGDDALDNGDILRLGYTTGVETAEEQFRLEDLRQMLGLRPATGRRPYWLDHVSPTNDPRLESDARRQGSHLGETQ